jgi:hypothetical protein
MSGKMVEAKKEAIEGWRRLVFQGSSLADESIKESDTDED